MCVPSCTIVHETLCESACETVDRTGTVNAQRSQHILDCRGLNARSSGGREHLILWLDVFGRIPMRTHLSYSVATLCVPATVLLYWVTGSYFVLYAALGFLCRLKLVDLSLSYRPGHKKSCTTWASSSCAGDCAQRDISGDCIPGDARWHADDGHVPGSAGPGSLIQVAGPGSALPTVQGASRTRHPWSSRRRAPSCKR